MDNEPAPKPISEEELGELFTFTQDPTEIIPGEGVVTVWALAWFPRDEWSRAIELWPELLDTMPADHDEYSKRVESNLKASAEREPGSPDVSPLSVDALLVEYGDEAGEARSRATMGAEVARSGKATAWPPGRNDTCWCKSGRKYKNCCGPVPSAMSSGPPA